MCSVADRQSQLEASVEKLSEAVQTSLTAGVNAAVLSSPASILLPDDEVFRKLMEKVDCKVDKSFAVLQNKLDSLSSCL